MLAEAAVYTYSRLLAAAPDPNDPNAQPAAGGSKHAPNISWTPDAGLQSFCSKLAFFVALFWIAFIIIKMASPKRRAMGGSGFSLVQIIFACLSVIILMNLDLIPTIVNGALDLIWWVGGLIGLN